MKTNQEDIIQRMGEAVEGRERAMQHPRRSAIQHTQTSWGQVKLPTLLSTYHHGMKNPVLYFTIEVGLKITSIGAHILPGPKNANYQGFLGRKKYFTIEVGLKLTSIGAHILPCP